MSKDQLLLLFCGLLLTTVLIFFLFLEKKEGKFDRLKKLALSTMISSGLFMSFYLVFGNLNYSVSQSDAGIAILGVLATVWVGLNIYNIVEKKEVDNLQQELKNSIIEINRVKEELKKVRTIWTKKYLKVRKIILFKI